MYSTMSHAANPAIIARLRRAQGHLGAIIAMVESGRGCLEISQQLNAVEKAVANAKSGMIQHYIEHCLEDQLGAPSAGSREWLGELKQLAKYL